MNFPELRRARKEWLTRPRLLLGALGSVGVAWLLSANANPTNAGIEITWEILILQHLILFFYGISSLISDFIDEHRRNSWDLLALTPLSASEVVFGKLAASTSYAVYLALVLAPWALWAQLLPGAKGFAHLFLQWAWLGTTFLASAFLSLAAAAATARLQGGKLGIGGAALGALGLLGAGLGQSILSETGSSPASALLVLVSGLWWAGWAAFAAVRQTGRLLGNRPSPWGLPLFLAGFWGFVLLFAPSVLRQGLSAAAYVVPIVPAAAALMAALLEREGSPWLRRKSLPSWAPSLATVALLCAATVFLLPAAARVAVMVPLFLTRDLLILTALRALRLRNAETVAAGLIGILYIGPSAALAAMGGAGLPWVIPFMDSSVGWAANCLPALLNAGGAAFLVRLAVTRGAKALEGRPV